MADFTPREKELLHLLFSPKSVDKLAEMFSGTSASEWESVYSKILGSGPVRRPDGLEMNRLILYVDGASHVAAKTAGIGGVLYSADEQEILTFSENIGEATSNVAEYKALIKGLEYARELNGDQISVFSDSELMVNQLNLEYKVKNVQIFRLYTRVTGLLGEFESWSIRHIPRSKNRKADILSNQALKRGTEDN